MNIRFFYEVRSRSRNVLFMKQKCTFHFPVVRLRNFFPPSSTKQDTITSEKHADINSVNNYLAFEKCKQYVKLIICDIQEGRDI